MKKNTNKSPKTSKLSVVIVNYNAGDHLLETLKSLDQIRAEVALDIWVVDNASVDGSIERAQKQFPKLHFILNQENLGFGAANNLALKQIKTEYILLLNPDTKILPNTLNQLISYMDYHIEVGALSCKLLKEDGSMDWSAHRGLPTPGASLLYFLGFDQLYHLSDKDMTRPHEVDSIAGSFFLTRKSVLDRVGLFDKDYWMYGEDLDLCFRIKHAGYKIIFIPNLSVVHLKGVSSGIKQHSQNISKATLGAKQRAFNSFYETMKIFYKKHLEEKYPFFINWLVYLGIDIRWFLAKRNLKV